jgi:Uma2 family endonuclease
MQARSDELMSIETFLGWAPLQDRRFELFQGRPVAMAGGSRRHSQIATRLLAALERKLRGSGCEAHGSDMAIRTGPATVRYPDAAVFCDRHELEGDAEVQHVLERPSVIFEVLSPSTAGQDRAVKLIEYRALHSLTTVVLVEPTSRRFDVHRRVSETEWLSVTHLPGATLTLTSPTLELTAEEIFGPKED